MSDSGWRWVTEDVVLAVHDEQIAEHAGGVGVRDMALVQSAPGRPRNHAVYGDADVVDLAAAYAFGIARNHGFVDGNKRTSFVVAYVFLLDHGDELTASDVDAVRFIVSMAAGAMEEVELAGWFRGAVRPIVPRSENTGRVVPDGAPRSIPPSHRVRCVSGTRCAFPPCGLLYQSALSPTL